MRGSIATRATLSLLAILAAASQLGATGSGGCSTQVIRDPGFDLWCGDVLCTWKLVTPEGTIRKAATWHAKDAGVEFVGGEAIIEQTSPVDSEDGTCIKFEMVANVEETAEMRLEIDVLGDGSVELDERIPTSAWKPLTYLIRIDPSYRGVRFQLSKRGSGKATLAQIAANTTPAADCEGFLAIAPAPAENGAWCDDDADCESGLCRITNDPSSWFGVRELCVGCDAGAPCDAGTVCGLGDGTSFIRAVPRECVPDAGDVLGEQCIVDGECASGICAGGYCSACDATRACSTGSCRVAYAEGPMTCSNAATGEPCAADLDCTSGRCEGAPRKQCADGRACGSPENCPVERDGTLEPGACTLVGVQGGTCT